MTDIAAADSFLATHARVLERHRLALLLGRPGAAAAVVASVGAYRNADGGFGWGLEPDLRAAGSQPAGAYSAFELFAELAEHADPAADAEALAAARALATGLADWADTVALDGGALPFSLAGAADAPGTAPWWAGADPAEPSLHITAGILRLAHLSGLAGDHPWVEAATVWTLEQVAASDGPPPGGGYTLAFVLGLLDALAPERPAAQAELERMAALVPADGALRPGGEDDDERLRPLRVSPSPRRPLRALMPAEAIAADLAALAQEQREDGGWTVDFPSSSPAAAVEWRGIATIEALTLLRDNGALATP
ncbi:hypothetical protein Q5424_25825 [Conexibacter sp. JD483]|uniref:hypothetical protein n=1 Tax=unclassified Conexibacter TaxID=2627773 RepID=UPI002728A4EC|nr:MULTISPECIES: hypothetical protein [unclassified Conexibacter]MDO8189365.1 hypothetical protein [Conexibacter sp. CPCC 205706]MDO8197358.1 hypothetical protein [Conexibacter sp. CPCC 205762]MDR9372544.1 hypothetical protein [Conexibacter sp. JD483]